MHACMPVEHELADAVVEPEEVRVGEAGALLVSEAPDGLVEPDGDVDGEDAAGERLHGHGAAHRVQQRPQPQHSHGGAGSQLQGANMCQSHTYIHFTAGLQAIEQAVWYQPGQCSVVMIISHCFIHLLHCRVFLRVRIG